MFVTEANNTAAPPPLGPDHSVQFLAPFSVLFALVAVTCVARVYNRALRQRLDWSDYTLILSFVLILVWFPMNIVLYTSYGRGVENYVYDFSILGPIEVTIGLLTLWNSDVIRISMGLMLLKLKDDRTWRWALWILIMAQFALIIVATCVQLAICRPLSAVWAPVPDAQCVTPEFLLHYAYVYNAFQILSDVVISLMPLTFIYGMRRSTLEKVLLCGLMAAGLLATAAAVVTLATVLGALEGSTIATSNVHIDILSTAQIFLGIIAANLPFLKTPVQGLLIDCGLLRHKRHAADASPDSFLGGMTHGSHMARQLQNMPTLRELPDEEAGLKEVSMSSASYTATEESVRGQRDWSASSGSGLSTVVGTASAERQHVDSTRDGRGAF